MNWFGNDNIYLISFNQTQLLCQGQKPNQVAGIHSAQVSLLSQLQMKHYLQTLLLKDILSSFVTSYLLT